MSATLTVQARWIDEDDVWIATSDDMPGLTIEGATWSEMVRETRLILPDLCELNGEPEPVEVVFKAEERLRLAA